ncbi:hypothetical protein Pcinc_040408 [Petrolisthes cinctipes]|uniref:Uncharacterized protein n=1 Tax=Petrolisthes cinctipes TaxID=88211 RepID=A0AAE1BQC6_PETCI|nr:hypothetical protein Pcinc_040408 [Petrolisthes cinctipes]
MVKIVVCCLRSGNFTPTNNHNNNNNNKTSGLTDVLCSTLFDPGCGGGGDGGGEGDCNVVLKSHATSQPDPFRPLGSFFPSHFPSAPLSTISPSSFPLVFPPLPLPTVPPSPLPLPIVSLPSSVSSPLHPSPFPTPHHSFSPVYHLPHPLYL